MRVDSFYVRVINLHEEVDDLERDSPLILSIIEGFEGVSFVRSLELHGRGGYCLFLSCSMFQRELILTALSEGGFRPAI